MVKVLPYDSIEIKRDGDVPFKVNGERVKHWIKNLEEVRVCTKIDLSEV